jgi:hypothetical protein
VQHATSELVDIWNDDVGDVEHELELWETLQLWTDQRDHWSQNGVLDCIHEWREQSDVSNNSILWICSENNGRQAWMTELSVDLLRVCRAQGQTITFGLCDRPRGIRWTPRQVLQQLIAQLLLQIPSLPNSNPTVLNKRAFRRATTFMSVFRLLRSLVGILESLVVVIDRLDLCIPDPDEDHPSIAQALSVLVKAYPKSFKVIVTTAQIIAPQSFPGLPISISAVKTRRRPRRRYEDRPRRSRQRSRSRSPIRMRPPPPPRTVSTASSVSSYFSDVTESEMVEHRLVPHG